MDFFILIHLPLIYVSPGVESAERRSICGASDYRKGNGKTKILAVVDTDGKLGYLGTVALGVAGIYTRLSEEIRE